MATELQEYKLPIRQLVKALPIIGEDAGLSTTGPELHLNLITYRHK